jgi:membrane-bound ClpP family serine protease
VYRIYLSWGASYWQSWHCLPQVFIEISAIVALLIGGYGMISQPINLWALGILLVGVIPFILAVRKSGNIIFLVISIVALVIGSVYLFKTDVWWQPAIHPALALLISVLAGGFMWIVARKGLEAIAIKPQNKLEELVGATGETQTEIDHRGGSVYCAGENWSARSAVPIPPNARVRVISREGFILTVEEIPEVIQPSSPDQSTSKPSSSSVSS